MTSLETYLRNTSQTLDQFGRSIGVSGVTIHRWVTGKARPSWDNVAAIQVATGGEVTANDFVPTRAPACRQSGEGAK